MSEILEAAYELGQALHSVGAMDDDGMRALAHMCGMDTPSTLSQTAMPVPGKNEAWIFEGRFS